MSGDHGFDYSKFAAELVSRLLTKLYGAVSEKVGQMSEAAKLSIGVGFSKYLEEMARRYSTAKTFFCKAAPQDIYSFYVPQDLVCDHHRIEDADPRSVIAVSKHVVITGSGGCGNVDAVASPSLPGHSCGKGDHIPILVPLRDLNGTARPDTA